MVELFCRGVETVNEWTGKIVRWALIPLTLIVTTDVILRYIFNKPTVWAWDVNVQLLGALAILGAGYTLLRGGHISVDVAVLRLSPRARAIIGIVTSVFFFFGIGVMLWKATETAWGSFLIRETMTTYLRPPIYPLRIVMVLGILLLLLQGVSKLIVDLGTAIRRGAGSKP